MSAGIVMRPGLVVRVDGTAGGIVGRMAMLLSPRDMGGWTCVEVLPNPEAEHRSDVPLTLDTGASGLVARASHVLGLRVELGFEAVGHVSFSTVGDVFSCLESERRARRNEGVSMGESSLARFGSRADNYPLSSGVVMTARPAPDYSTLGRYCPDNR